MIKDAHTMIVSRAGDVPLRTRDGGDSWHPMPSCAPVASFGHGLLYSWSRQVALPEQSIPALHPSWNCTIVPT